jgi:hypothetical protein
VTSVHDHLRHRFRWKVHSNHRICPSSLESHQSLDHDPWDLTNQRPSRGSASKINKSQKAKKKHPCLGIFLFAQLHVIIQHLYRLYYIFSVIIKQGAQDMQRKRRTVLKLLGRSDLYLSYIMFTCSALFGKELASSGGWNQAYCSAESARIGVLLLPSGLDVCFLLYILLSLKIPRGLGGKICVFDWGGR